MHPDLFSSAQFSTQEKEISSHNSVTVNLAYQALKSDGKRIRYLLELHGIDALAETSTKPVAPELLIEIMEIRESVDECTSLEELSEYANTNVASIRQCTLALKKDYDESHDLEKVTAIAVKLKYLAKIEEEIRRKEDLLQQTP